MEEDMFYQNYSHAYQFEQSRKSAECEKKFIELRKELYELDGLHRQCAIWRFAPYMQPADLQKRIDDTECRCTRTFREMGKAFFELDERHKQSVILRCMKYTMSYAMFAA